MDALQSVMSVRYKNMVFSEPTVKGDEDALQTFGVAGSDSVIKIAPVTPLDISSSMLRKRIANRQTVRYLVPEGVWRYLEKNEKERS